MAVFGAALAWLKVLLVLWMAGLPLAAGVCWWQRGVAAELGDEPLARSWGDATRSFATMTVASWLLVGLGLWARQLTLRVLDAAGTG